MGNRKEKKKRTTRDDSEFRNETIFNIQQFFFILIYKTLCAVLNDERIAGMQIILYGKLLWRQGGHVGN